MLCILAVGGSLEKSQKVDKKETARLNNCFCKTCLGATSFRTHLFQILGSKNQ